MYVSDISSWIGIPTISALIVAVLLLLFYGSKQRKNLPPGPPSFPLIGSLPSLIYSWYRTGDRPEQLLAKMATDYGELFTFNIGNTVFFVVNGYKSIREAFQNPHLNDRPGSRLMEEAAMDTGLVMVNGKSWLHQRKFTTKTLYGFGVGKNSFEGHISSEAEILTDKMSENKDKPFQPKPLIMRCVSNIICSVTFGKRYSHTDPKFVHLLDIMTKLIKKIGAGSALVFFPIMKYIAPQRYNEFISIWSDLLAHVESEVDEHEKLFDKTNMNDFIDVFLNELDELPKKKGDLSDIVNRKTLLATTVFLFIGGSETTSKTLTWVFLYMIMYPDVQAKVQEEMDRVVGRQRMPQWADRYMLPYTEAVLHEIQRIRTIIPINFFHVAAEDTQVAGYNVPKDALILANLWGIHNDPAVWLEPDQFKPERFLDENGKLCVPKQYMPFSTGRRNCPGANLAVMEVFLFVTNALHKCVFKKVPGCSYSLEVEDVADPMPYEMIAETRD